MRPKPLYLDKINDPRDLKRLKIPQPHEHNAMKFNVNYKFVENLY